jgi:hypothetical protein
MGNNPLVTDIFHFIPDQIKIKRDELKKDMYLWQKKINEKLEDNQNNFAKSKEKSPETRGHDQHTANMTLKVENDRHTLDELVRKSNRSIISISSIFPWNFFPNTIDVEESRVTFIFRQLFASQTHSVDIKELSNVFLE